jgi:hypothetical protein
MRWAALVVLLGIALVVLCTAAALAAGAAQERAMTRCTATPPGFPSKLSRAGTTITVDWKLFPFSYECVYETRDRVVRRPPP